jgi:hypothetical protein
MCGAWHVEVCRAGIRRARAGLVGGAARSGLRGIDAQPATTDVSIGDPNGFDAVAEPDGSRQCAKPPEAGRAHRSAGANRHGRHQARRPVRSADANRQPSRMETGIQRRLPGI